MSDSATLRDTAYHKIRAQLASGEMARLAVLSEPRLARQLGMSRTPVREAVRRLVFEGFLVQTPKKGTAVRSLGRDDVAELYELRELVEGYAAAESAERMSGADLDVMARLVARMSAVAREAGRGGDTPLSTALAHEFFAVDLAFHLMILRSVQNTRIAKIAADFQLLMRLFSQPREMPTIRVVARSYAWHRRILRAIGRRDARMAREAMWGHIRAGKAAALQRFCFGENERGPANAAAPGSLWEALPPDVYSQMGFAFLEMAGRETRPSGGGVMVGTEKS
jgi:DNA-binding GntR family transcriptional regulator